MSVEIPVHDGGEASARALVSPIDAGLRRWKWSMHSNGYAVRKTSVRRADHPGEPWGVTVYMHRQIAGLDHEDPRVVDHINGDRMDNRRTNLRIVVQAENCKNVYPRQRRRLQAWADAHREKARHGYLLVGGPSHE